MLFLLHTATIVESTRNFFDLLGAHADLPTTGEGAIGRHIEGSPASLTNTRVGEPYPVEFMDYCQATPLSPSLDPNVYPGAFTDFYGLPSNPICLYRTGEPWPVPKAPQAQRIPRELRTVHGHRLLDTWDSVAPTILEYLDSNGVRVSTIDVARFAEAGGPAGPVHVWIGVHPGTLDWSTAKIMAIGCKDILVDEKFPDVEVALRESSCEPSVGLELERHVCPPHPVADFQSLFSGVLGVTISPQSSPHLEGTGALYICQGGESDRIFLLTARHVVLPATEPNELYSLQQMSQPAKDVLILGERAYRQVGQEVVTTIADQISILDRAERTSEWLAAHKDADATDALSIAQSTARMARTTMTTLNNFHRGTYPAWELPICRVIGQVYYSPPISLGTGVSKFTEDWALVEVDRQKIDFSAFKGNAIYLGLASSDLERKLHPQPKGCAFRCPEDGLLRLKGVVSETEIRQPTAVDESGDPCLIVIKRGAASNVTVGRVNGFKSIRREYSAYGIKSTSLELAIFPYDHKSSSFSEAGDSGSIVADGQGRVVGLLTGGAGLTRSTDVTYATPYFWLQQQIQAVYPGSHLYPAGS